MDHRDSSDSKCLSGKWQVWVLLTLTLDRGDELSDNGLEHRGPGRVFRVKHRCLGQPRYRGAQIFVKECTDAPTP